MKLLKNLMLFLAVVGAVSCVSEGQLKDKVAKILKENPKVLTDAIEANPAEFVEAVQKAAKNAQQVMARKEKKKKERNLKKHMISHLLRKFVMMNLLEEQKVLQLL